MTARAHVLGFPLDPLPADEAAAWVLAACRGHETRVIVTLNPEILVRARRDAALQRALLQADLSVADGVGIVWAARRAGIAVPGRVPGIDLACDVLARGGSALRVYLLGGRPGVAARAATHVAERWGVQVVGHRDGYFGSDEERLVVAEIAASGAQLILAGLGERQEVFLDRYRTDLGVGAAIGVGGTLDVLAGEVRRAPTWTRRVGLEWAWRVGTDPRRWRRLPNLVRFALLALRAPKPHPRGG